MNNHIKGQLESYRPTKRWIDKTYPEKRFELEHKLIGHKPITYDEILTSGGKGLDESLRRSGIIDEINDLENRLRYSKMVIRYCEEVFEMIRPEYKGVIELRFKQGKSINTIARKTSYNHVYIYEIIEKETNRLSNC